MPATPKPIVRRTRHLHIYGDESSQNAHNYLVIGTIACEAERMDRVVAKLEASIATFRKASELKWEKLGKLEQPMYEAFIGALFDTFKSENVRFHSIVVDMTKANDAKYNEGNSEIGFSKYVFTLLNKYTSLHKQLDPIFKVYLDERDTTHTLDTTRRSLNRRAFNDYGHWKYPIFDTIEYVKSHEHRLVQAADIITGAVAYIWNGHHEQKIRGRRSRKSPCAISSEGACGPTVPHSANGRCRSSNIAASAFGFLIGKLVAGKR